MIPSTLEQVLTSSPDFIIQLGARFKEEQTARIEAEKKIEAMIPIAEYHDAVLKQKA